jgi:hypothetical protein
MTITKERLKEIRKFKTAIIYDGPSLINQTAILGIVHGLQGNSQNRKIGKRMASIIILVKDMHPIDAVKSGADSAICGECPYRLIDGKRLCYVNLIFEPGTIYKAYNANKLPVLSPGELNYLLLERSLNLRLGSYGDIGAIPADIVLEILAGGIKSTSYTHQWGREFFDPRVLEYSMASLDHINTLDKLKAKFPRARYYKTILRNETPGPGEIMCPSKPGPVGYKGPREVVCSNCLLCGGTAKQAKNITEYLN